MMTPDEREALMYRGAAALVTAWDLFLKSREPTDPVVRAEWARIGHIAEHVREAYAEIEV